MIPYVDPETFSTAPTGIDPKTIVDNDDEAAQLAELENVLERASKWIDNVCRQRLAATTDQERKRVRPNRYGELEIYPRNFPIISLLAAEWMDLSLGQAAAFTTVNVTYSQLLDRGFVINDRSYSCYRAWGRQPLLVQFQYENGYAHTTLTADASDDDTTITVGSTIGIGTTSDGASGWNLESELLILDGESRETVTVASISGNTLTLTSPLEFDHAEDVLVTSVPQDVQQTCIDFAAYLIRTRGVAGMEMTDRGWGGQTSAPGAAAGMGLEEAFKRLIPYTRMGAA